MDGPHFETRVDDGECVLVASGEFDMASADAFRAVLEPLDGRVIVDLSAVTFFDSSAIGVLVWKRNDLQAKGGELVIRRPHDLPRRVLELTGLGDWIVD